MSLALAAVALWLRVAALTQLSSVRSETWMGEASALRLSSLKRVRASYVRYEKATYLLTSRLIPGV